MTKLLAFTRGERAPAAEPTVTIQKGGIFSLNESAVRLLVPEGDPAEVRVGFPYSEDGKSSARARAAGRRRTIRPQARGYARPGEQPGSFGTRPRPQPVATLSAYLHDPRTLAFRSISTRSR
jgi:hypothetical protein